MDRIQELNALLNAPTPPALEGTVARAQKRYTRARMGKVFGIPVASLCGAAAAFVLLVNTSIPFARACGNIPILKEFAAAVALSPSLKAAVEHDYVQPVGAEQTDNGVTMRIEYLIVDKKQLNIFFSLESEKYPGLLWGDPGVEGVTGGSVGVSSGKPEEGELHHVTVDFMRGDMPGSLTFTYEVRYSQGAWATAPVPTKAPDTVWDGEEHREEPESIARFSFPLTFDSAFTEAGVTYHLNTPFTLDGQHFTAKTVEVYPSQVRFNLEADEDNTALLKGLEFYLTDEKGRKYEPPANGTTASGSEGGMTSFYLESNYFDRAEHLTIHITKALWLDKAREYVMVDIPSKKVLSPMPEGVGLLDIERTGNDLVRVVLSAKLGGEDAPYRTDTYSVSSWEYRDPEGGEHHFNSMSTSGGFRADGIISPRDGVPEGCFTEEFFLPNYPWDTVELGMCFSRFTTFDTPIEIPVG